ncbi:hypothetical protein ACK369_04120 [Aeromonas veronii]|uniref:hypothetical protein n=1 Tax=Aeromonas veronii TaxID=654 RepID=UPI00191D9B38|nr:hypothetical protein [Aeromonas veronii]MBL0466545.1 hypothetical protein [Aeromonas veronii]
MTKSILLIYLFTPMAHAIGVISQYSDLRQSYFDADGKFKYRITVEKYNEDFSTIKSANWLSLMSISRLQSQSVSLGQGTFETLSTNIRFTHGTYSRGDIVLFNTYGCNPSNCFSSHEVRIRLSDLQLQAGRTMLFDTNGQAFAHKRSYQLSLR